MAEKTSVILASQNDWDEWIEVVKSIAIGDDIWEFINPDTPESSLLPLEEPRTPMPADIDPRKTTFSSLDEDEKEELRELRRERRRKLEQYDRQRRAMKAMRIRIQETVSRTNLPYTFDCDTVYHMLVQLQQQLSPTDDIRERELILQYHRVKAPPKNQNVDIWLRDWQRIYDKCRKQQIPDTDGNRAVRDFLSAVQAIEPGFSTYWRNKLIDGDGRITLPEIVKRFREYQSESSQLLSQGAFSVTFQGKEIERKCLCGDIHHFKDCPYLIKANRRPDWQPNPKIKQEIDEKLRSNEKLQKIIERLRKDANEEETPPVTF